MASSEGAIDVSTEERFERKKAELIGMIDNLAKRLSLDEWPILGAGSTSGHKDPYKKLLEDELAKLIHQYEMLAAQLDFDNGHGRATTTINGSNVGAGSTSGHENSYIARLETEKAALRRERELGAGQIGLDDGGVSGTSGHENSYIARKKAELRRQRESGAGQIGPDDGHRAATTISNGRDYGAGNTIETPQIIVCTPEDVFGADATTNNGRGLGAGSTFTAVLDDGIGVVANPFNGRYLEPGSRLRQRGLGAGRTFQMVPGDVLGAANTANGREIEARSAFINHVAQLLQHVDVNAELDNNNNFTQFKRMLALCTGVAVSAFFVGYFRS